MTTEQPAVRVVLYPRVSSRKQEQEGFGLDYQERLCREYAERHGWEIVGVEREAFTGTVLDDRPALSRIRAAVPSGQFAIVLAVDIDRSQREDWFYGFLRDEWAPYGVRWKFVDEPENADAEMLETWRAFQGMFARMKHRDGLKKTRNGRIERGRQGFVIPSGYPPYGYDFADVELEGGKVRKRARFVVNETEAAVVQRLYQQAADGVSTSALVRDLEVRGVPTKVRGHWQRKTVDRILRNPLYKGERHNFTTIDPRTPTERRFAVQPAPVARDYCPAIVDAALWGVVQEMLDGNKARSVGSTLDPEQVWFKGYVRCGVCGGRMRALRQSRGASYQYACKPVPPRTCTAQGAISPRILDGEAITLIRDFFDNPLWLNAQLTHLEATHAAATDEIATLDRRLADLATRKTQIMETAIQAPPDLKPMFFEQVRGVEAEIDHHTSRRGDLVRRQAETAEHVRLARSLGDDDGRRRYWPAAVGRESFAAMDYADWQRIFRRWKPVLTVWPAGHEPRWKLEFEAVVTEAFDPAATASAMEELAATAESAEATALRETARDLRESLGRSAHPRSGR